MQQQSDRVYFMLDKENINFVLGENQSALRAQAGILTWVETGSTSLDCGKNSARHHDSIIKGMRWCDTLGFQWSQFLTNITCSSCLLDLVRSKYWLNDYLELDPGHSNQVCYCVEFIAPTNIFIRQEVEFYWSNLYDLVRTLNYRYPAIRRNWKPYLSTCHIVVLSHQMRTCIPSYEWTLVMFSTSRTALRFLNLVRCWARHWSQLGPPNLLRCIHGYDWSRWPSFTPQSHKKYSYLFHPKCGFYSWPSFYLTISQKKLLFIPP